MLFINLALTNSSSAVVPHSSCTCAQDPGLILVIYDTLLVRALLLSKRPKLLFVIIQRLKQLGKIGAAGRNRLGTDQNVLKQ
jgi:hypothetical protein